MATASEATDKPASVSDIEGKRSSGMGWGQIAQSLGLHPSSVGLGNVNKSEQATAVGHAKGDDSGRGFGSGHGSGIGSGGGGGGSGGGGGGGGGK